jgi:hypothetical protein
MSDSNWKMASHVSRVLFKMSFESSGKDGRVAMAARVSHQGIVTQVQKMDLRHALQDGKDLRRTIVVHSYIHVYQIRF